MYCTFNILIWFMRLKPFQNDGVSIYRHHAEFSERTCGGLSAYILSLNNDFLFPYLSDSQQKIAVRSFLHPIKYTKQYFKIHYAHSFHHFSCFFLPAHFPLPINLQMTYNLKANAKVQWNIINDKSIFCWISFLSKKNFLWCASFWIAEFIQVVVCFTVQLLA